MARELLTRAIHDIEPQGCASPDRLSMYGTLLEVAAYTAAVDGNRPAASELIGEAKATASRLGEDANHRFTAFARPKSLCTRSASPRPQATAEPPSSARRCCAPRRYPPRNGEAGTGSTSPAPTTNGAPEPCYRALLAAERAAPAEVRYRPPVHRIAKDLLRAENRSSLPGLPAFARRIGVPAT
jgi:hypothetical protein